jgi:preprotein translocase subunit SecD
MEGQMERGLLWRGVLAILVILGTVLVLLPDITGGKVKLGNIRIRKGLDLQGGIYAVYQVDKDELRHNVIGNRMAGLKSLLEAETTDSGSKISIKDEATDVETGKITFTALPGALSQIEDATKSIDLFSYEGYEDIEDSQRVKVTLNVVDATINALVRSSIDRVLNVVRTRIDLLGLTEPTIVKNNKDQIVVLLPGEKDPQRASDMIKKVARLEFRLLYEEQAELEKLIDPVTNELKAGAVLPANTQIMYEMVKAEESGLDPVVYLVETEVPLSGEDLTDATVFFDDFSPDGPTVSMTLKTSAGKTFAKLTRENVGRRLAIILDDHVYSAPNINEEIPNGRASISGRFTPEEATDMANVLKTGALPAKLIEVEKYSVGPELGADSIRKGSASTLAAIICILIFMLIYYKLSGIIANMALVLNLALIMAFMAYFGATLTLPGIAGIVLTMGMAVDANVLIFERIKEELRNGKTIRSAIDAGYARAFKTILDANVTTLIAAVMLINFGQGSVRGFAITLCFGLIISMFTAIFLTRIVFDFFTSRGLVRKLSI